MGFSSIYGNDVLKSALRTMADSGKVPHAIMFYENDGGGALDLIQAFMQYLNCGEHNGDDACGKCPSCGQTAKFIHPDIHYTFPITSGTKVSGEVGKLICSDFSQYWRELVTANPYFLESELTEALGIDKKSGAISIAEGRDIQRRLSMSSVTGGYRAVVIYLPEKMNVQTANSLLKLIEEPPEQTLFMMITHSPHSVLQTISSRCLHVRVLPLTKTEVAQTLVSRFGISPSEADEVASYCGGSVGLARYELSDKAATAVLENLFGDLMDKILSRDLLSVLSVGEELAALESREKQKAFCNFAGEAMRKIFLLRQGMESISFVSPGERAFYQDLAARCAPSFPKNAVTALDKATMLLDRNVNQKIIFCNLVNRLFSVAVTS